MNIYGKKYKIAYKRGYAKSTILYISNKVGKKKFGKKNKIKRKLYKTNIVDACFTKSTRQLSGIQFLIRLWNTSTDSDSFISDGIWNYSSSCKSSFNSKIIKLHDYL